VSLASSGTSFTVERSLHVRPTRGGRKRVDSRAAPPPVPAESGRIPRISRLLGLAHRMQRLVDEGTVQDYSELARLGGVTTARMTQIMSLMLLAPDIQEEILFLPRVFEGRDPIHERAVGRLVRSADWRAQRREWVAMRARAGCRL